MESILSYSLETQTLDYMLKEERVSTEMDFWRRAARTFRVRSN